MTTTLQAIVHSNLDSAIENGYTEILEWTAEDIAQDLLCYADDCSSLEIDDLVPHIKTWLDSKAIR